jgi:hypothetical protein
MNKMKNSSHNITTWKGSLRDLIPSHHSAIIHQFILGILLNPKDLN